MTESRQLLSNRSLTLALLFYTVLSTYQVSQLVFKNGYEYYPYFLAVGALIFSIKVFFAAYYALVKEIESKNTIGLIFNLGFVISQLWLMQTGLGYLRESFYPQETFQTILIASIIFFLQVAANGFMSVRRSNFISIIYYAGIFALLFFNGFAQAGIENLLTFQTISILFPVLELWQLTKLIFNMQE